MKKYMTFCYILTCRWPIFHLRNGWKVTIIKGNCFKLDILNMISYLYLEISTEIQKSKRFLCLIRLIVVNY